ncbi:uncharacterized protein LOC116259084 [Nymphaea colorata]|nr:uncharacterized protein LOC116259084 [Nymphaea colorata]
MSSSVHRFVLPTGTKEEIEDGSERRFLFEHDLYSERLIRRSRKKLLVLDVNGLLAHTVFETNTVSLPANRRADGVVGRKLVFKRPFCDDFVRFCFEKFEVGIWSSARKNNVEGVVLFLLGDLRYKLLFCWDQSECTDTGMRTLDKSNKPLFLKELHRLWNSEGLPWPKDYYSSTNTLLIDDSPYKALRNPPFTAVFPEAYDVNNDHDSSLGPGGDIRNYLQGIANAPDVQQYVQARPFGQPLISQADPNWWFYSQIGRHCHHQTMVYGGNYRL